MIKYRGNLVSLTTTLIIGNLIYIVFNYMPYMLLALIYDPLQTSMTYLALIIYTVLGYFLLDIFISTFKNLRKNKKKLKLIDQSSINQPSSNDLFNHSASNVLIAQPSNTNMYTKVWLQYVKGFLLPFMKLAMFFVCAIGSFSVGLIYILTWGSFYDFRIIQNLIWPLLIGLITILIAKPTHVHVKKRFHFENRISEIEIPETPDT